MKTKNRKIWSLGVALAMVLVFAGMLTASVMAQSSRPSVPSSMTIVADPADGGSPILVYKVSSYNPSDGDTGYGAINPTTLPIANVVTTQEIPAEGTPVPSGSRAQFGVEFLVASDAEPAPTDGTQFDRLTLTAPSPLAPGTTYTVRITATYDSDLSRDASGEGNDSGGDTDTHYHR